MNSPETSGTCRAPVVLIVDDDAANRTGMRAVLGPLGFVVLEAASGQEALLTLLKHDIAGIIMDVRMPGMDGFETVALIRERERNRHVPVVFVTANEDDSARKRRGIALGAVDYIAKPFDVDLFRAKIAGIVKNQQEHEEEVAASREAATRIKDEFLAVISHELRTPLNAILSWAELLAADRLEPADGRKAAVAIVRNAKMQRRLIDDLLDFSRVAAGKLQLHRQRVDIGALVTSTVDSLRPAASEPNIEFRIVTEGEGFEIEADGGRVQQALSNLLTNAIKFSNASGSIEIKIDRQDDAVRISVADQGIGISSDFLAHVFDYFRQEHNGAARPFGGLGLGLAITKRIVDLHGGKLSVASDGHGKGATFTICLPVRAAGANIDVAAAAATAFEIAPSTAAYGCLERLRILFVDDDFDNLDAVGSVLESAGAEVVPASSAKEAVELLNKAPVDVILSDIGMPDEDGLSMIRRIRAGDVASRQTPALALSAHASSDDRDQSLSAGFDDHLGKPVDASLLVAVLARMAGRRAG
jgi:signal transduction histidine kinase